MSEIADSALVKEKVCPGKGSHRHVRYVPRALARVTKNQLLLVDIVGLMGLPQLLVGDTCDGTRG